MVIKTSSTASIGVMSGVMRGRVIEVDNSGLITVALASNEQQLHKCELLETAAWQKSPLEAGDRVVFLPAACPDNFGCVFGRIGRHPRPDAPTATESTGEVKSLTGRQIEIKADSNLVLKCGKGSISIREDGTIVIKGSRLLSRSSGINKIKGAAVQIN